MVATSCEELTHWKRLWRWEGLRAGGERDDRGWDGWMASLTRWTWVWMNSGSWWWTGRPGVLWFMGSQRVGHDWDWTELNWIKPYNCIYKWMYSVMMEIVKDFKRIEINFISLSKKIKTHHVSSGRNTCLLMWYMKLGRRPQNRSYINNSLRSFLIGSWILISAVLTMCTTFFDKVIPLARSKERCC